MKLSKSTLDILKNFASINPSALLKAGDLINTKSINNVIYAEAKLAEPLDEELGIYDLGEFLGIMNLLGEDAELTIQGDKLQIVNGRSKAKTNLSDASVIAHPKSALVLPVADVVFELKKEDYDKLNKAASMMSLTQLCFTAHNGKIVARGVRNDTDNNYSIEVADYDGTASFEFYVNFANLKLIDGDYKVMISKLGAVKFEGSLVNYIIALESNSKFNG